MYHPGCCAGQLRNQGGNTRNERPGRGTGGDDKKQLDSGHNEGRAFSGELNFGCVRWEGKSKMKLNFFFFFFGQSK